MLIDNLLSFLRAVPLTEQNFPRFISLLHGAFGTNGAQLILMSGSQKSGLLQSFEIDLPESIGRDYAHYHDKNPRILMPFPDDEVFVDTSYLNREWFRKTEFYDWYSREARSSEMMMFRIAEDTAETAMLVIGRDQGFGYFSEEDLTNGKLVLGQLKTNLALTEATNSNWLFAEALISQVAPHSAVLLMSREGQIVGATEAASQIIDSWPDLFLFHQTLRWQRSCAGLGAACRNALQSGVSQCIRCEERRGDGQSDLEISVMPLSHPLRGLGKGMLLLRFTLLPSGRKVALTGLLSPAEFAVCSLLAQGLTLRDISDLRQVSYNTVRNQLTKAHDKLKTRSIPDILRLYGSQLVKADAPGE